MRFALSVASVLVLTSAAFAEEAKPAEAPPPAAAPAPAAGKKLSLRVVRVLAETQQALLFDKTKGTHVLVEVGQQVDGFKVTDIDEDTVTLAPIDGGSQVVLAGPDPSWRRHRDAKPAPAAPEDPYASTAAPVDPYAEDAVRTVQAPDAPIAAGEGGVRTVQAPDASAPPPRVASAAAVTAPAAAIITPVAAPVAEPVAAPSAEPAGPTDTSSTAAWSTTPDPTASTLAAAMTDAKPAKPTKADPKSKTAPKQVAPAVVEAPAAPAGDVLARADVAAALGNFGALASAVRGSFTAGGAHLDAVAPDSLFAKAGLRAGDTITEINHQPMHSIDDAANLYSRASVLKTVTIQLVRAGKPMTLQLSIR